MNRFRYACSTLMAGRLDKAADGFRRLPGPEDERWVPAREKVRRMLARADVTRAVTPLDDRDLRGWHYMLTGGVLAGLSPHGFDTGTTGRYCFLGDSAGECASALRRLSLVLGAAGAAPECVALLPNRSSRIPGLAAAAMPGLSAADFCPGRPAPRSLVVACDLNAVGPDAVAALRRRAAGQVLSGRAMCRTSPPRVAADVSGLLAEHVLAPRDGQWQRLDDGSICRGAADDRTAEVIAAEPARTAPEQEEGDGSAPADPDDALRRFARAVADDGARERDGGWLGGIREHVPNSGPVPGSRLI